MLALIPTAISIIFNADGITKVPEFGACIFTGDAFTQYFLATVIPVTVNSILAMILNIYLAIVAYQVHKQIEKETRLSGGSSRQSERVTALKRKQRNTRRNMRPIITLLVVSFCNIFKILVFTVLHMLGKNSSASYRELVECIIILNTTYFIHLFNPLVYGL